GARRERLAHDGRSGEDQPRRPRRVAVDAHVRPHVDARREHKQVAGADVDLVVVGALEPETPGTGVGPDLWPQAAEQGVQAPPGNDPPGLADAGGKVGLDPLPLARERLLPVGLAQPPKPLQQAPRTLPAPAPCPTLPTPGPRLVHRRPRAAPPPGRRTGGDSLAAVRADQRHRNLQAHQLLADAAQPPQLTAEVRELSSRRREEELREV